MIRIPVAVLKKALQTSPRSRPRRLRDTGRVMSEEPTTPDSFKSMRRTMVAYSRGDFDVQMSFYAPDAVLDMSSRGLGVFEGRAAIRGFWEDYYRSFEDLKFELEEALDFGNGVMFAVVR
jgi:ketosteroid isomerase-like protein